MPRYYVNDIPERTGEHEVHDEDCHLLPRSRNRTPLGQFDDSEMAVLEAMAYYDDVDGCGVCSPDSHTR